MRCVSRSISPTLPRRLTTPLDRVQSFTAPNGPGPRGMPSSLAEKYSRSCGKSMPRQGDRTANARWQPRFRMLSSNWTAPEVDQVTHTEAFGDFPQLRATGREESAQQPIPAKRLDLKLPALGITAQPLENLSQLRRDRSLSLAKMPAGVVDQLDSKKVPRVLSWRLASRESGSFRHFMNQPKFCSRSRAFATHFGSASRP
jgi:hypothetical protein